MRTFLLVAMLLVPLSAPAETLAVEGTAQVVAGDLDAARSRAIDEALRKAVEDAVAAVLTPEARSAHAEVIRKRILRAARTYVGQFRVRGEEATAGSYRVQVEATVAEERLRRDLVALGTLAGTPETPPSSAKHAARVPVRIVLLVAALGAGVDETTFGQGTSPPGLLAETLEKQLRARGFEVLLTTGQPVPAGETTEPPLPLSDAQAEGLGRAVGAAGALVGGWQIADEGSIRGTRLVGARATGAVRLLVLGGASTGRVAGEARLDEGGFGSSARLAAEAVAQASAMASMRALAGALEKAWPREAGASVPVRVRAGEYAQLAEIIRILQRVPGVASVNVARLEGGEVSLAVEGSLGGAAIARALVDAQFSSDPPVVRAARDHVMVEWPAEPVVEGRP